MCKAVTVQKEQVAGGVNKLSEDRIVGPDK